jgi:transposase
VLTTPATTSDFAAPAIIHAELAEKDLLPDEHLFDAGYVDAELLVDSERQHQVAVIGPVALDHCWQALAPDAYDISHFVIDWEAKRVTCPQGHLSQKWSQTQKRADDPIINVRFAPAACSHCPVRQKCTRSQAGPRNITFHPKPVHEALLQRRIIQNTPEFKRQYAARAGIEATISQSVRVTDLRHARYIGLAKIHLQHLLCAAAINLCRITDYISELADSCSTAPPFVRPRTPAFASLATTP